MSNKVRFLITGDIHVDKFRQFATTLPNGLNSRLWNCLRVFDIILRVAKERKIDKVILNGDIFNDSDEIDTEVYGEVYRRLELLHRNSIDTTINMGNHDVAIQTRDRLVHSLLALRKVARIVTVPRTLYGMVHVVPFTGNTESYRKWIELAANEPRHTLVSHIGITEGRIGASGIRVKGQVDLQALRPDAFRLVLLSDYHLRQKVADHVYYLGSPLQHTFGEQHEPCIWEVQLLDRKPYYLLRAIPTALPRFISLQDRSLQLEDIQSRMAAHRGSYFRIRTSHSTFEIEKIAEKYDCQVQFEHIPKHKQNAKVNKQYSLEEAVESYAGGQTWIEKLGQKLLK